MASLVTAFTNDIKDIFISLASMKYLGSDTGIQPLIINVISYTWCRGKEGEGTPELPTLLFNVCLKSESKNVNLHVKNVNTGNWINVFYVKMTRHVWIGC